VFFFFFTGPTLKTYFEVNTKNIFRIILLIFFSWCLCQFWNLLKCVLFFDHSIILEFQIPWWRLLSVPGFPPCHTVYCQQWLVWAISFSSSQHDWDSLVGHVLRLYLSGCNGTDCCCLSWTWCKCNVSICCGQSGDKVW